MPNKNSKVARHPVKAQPARVPVAIVVHNIRGDIQEALASIDRRLHRNPHGYKEEEIQAAMGANAATLLSQHLQTGASADAALEPAVIAKAISSAAVIAAPATPPPPA